MVKINVKIEKFRKRWTRGLNGEINNAWENVTYIIKTVGEEEEEEILLFDFKLWFWEWRH